MDLRHETRPTRQRLADLLASARFPLQPDGYEPAMVDRFVEDLAARCADGGSPADLHQRVAAAGFPLREQGYAPADVDALLDRLATEVAALEAATPGPPTEDTTVDGSPAPSSRPPRSSAVFKAPPTTPVEDHLMTSAQPEQPIPFRIVLRG